MSARAARLPLTVALYRVLGRGAMPLVRLVLRRRAGRGKELPERLDERLGVPGRARPSGPLLWVHAASVGEMVSVLPLVERILDRHPPAHALITTGTVTSARLAAGRLPARAFHQFVPLDVPVAVDRFVAHWRPDLVLWTESEIWPALIAAVAATGAPLVLVQGRISLRSFTRWRWLRGLIAPLLGRFALCLAQSERDARHLLALGAPKVRYAGNLKLAAPPLSASPVAVEQLRLAVGGRPCWLAASTHPGEEAIVGDVHARLAQRHPDLLTLLVPRHPERGEAIAALLRGRGLKVTRRAAGDGIGADTAIYLADTLGELGLWYRLAGVVFMGGSLVPHGGQNPLEPLRLGCAVLHGPHMGNFAELVEGLREAQGAIEVAGPEALAQTMEQLLFADASARAGLARRGMAWVEMNENALDRVLKELGPFLDRLG